MSSHALLNLSNKLGKRDKMRGLPSILSLFRNMFNHFNNTGAQMLDCIYHYIIIDFDEVDIRIYQPEKVIFTEVDGNTDSGCSCLGLDIHLKRQAWTSGPSKHTNLSTLFEPTRKQLFFCPQDFIKNFFHTRTQLSMKFQLLNKLKC